MEIFLKFKKYFADFRNIFVIHLWCIELCAQAVHVTSTLMKHARAVHRVLFFTQSLIFVSLDHTRMPEIQIKNLILPYTPNTILYFVAF